MSETSTLALNAAAVLSACASGPVTWTLAGAPLGMTIDANTGAIAWTPPCDAFEAGPDYGPIAAVAHASSGDSVSAPFVVHVTNTPGSVVVTAIANQSVAEGVALSVVPSASFVPCASGAVTWSATGLPSGANVNASTGEFTWTPPCNAFEGGPLYGPITLVATAASGVSGEAAFAITVTNTPGSIAAVTSLSATQVVTGNDTDGTTRIHVAFSAPIGSSSVEVYRAGFGGYPEYDDAGGAAPIPPTTYPPAAPWARTSITAPNQDDEPATRDVWFYVAFARDSCGNVSSSSAMTSGTLNYHLGDVTNGTTIGVGNNAVTTADISLLGAHYGALLSANDPFNYLDIGPTTTRHADGRPLTDNQIQFEDMILFAINFAQVAGPVRGPHTATSNEITLRVPAPPPVGETFDVPIEMQGAGDVHGLSMRVDYDSLVVEPVASGEGPLLLTQALPGIAWSAAPAAIDAALLGTGPGITGSGTVAHVTFRVKAAGDPRIQLASLDARDAANEHVDVASRTDAAPILRIPTSTFLAGAAPNPVRSATLLRFGLPSAADRVRLEILDVRGRVVRTLLADEPLAAGERGIAWDGQDAAGRPVGSGMYIARLSVNGRALTRPLRVVR